MQQYLDLCHRIIEMGEWVTNRLTVLGASQISGKKTVGHPERSEARRQSLA